MVANKEQINTNILHVTERRYKFFFIWEVWGSYLGCDSDYPGCSF